jgi:hypothetical protein
MCFFTMGKTVYCISNGSHEMFPNNTLTTFGNKFPFIYDYGSESNNYKLQVAVDALGFSLKFNQSFLPNPMVSPCMIFEYGNERLGESQGFVLRNNKIGDISFTTASVNESVMLSYIYIHIENSVLTLDNVFKLMKKLRSIFIISRDRDFNTINLKTREDTNVNVFFISKLFPFLKIESLKPANRQEILNGENYKVYSCKQGDSLTLDLNGILSLNLPKIIKVKCPNIRDQIYNNTNEKDLLVFCPQIDHESGNDSMYFFHEFESRTYCTLENTILDRINFQLVNEYDELLHLDTGVPTLIKLNIIAMEKTKKAFNIRAASELHNRSNFTVKLPQTLHFNDKWRVNLSSINLPNTFNTFHNEEDLIMKFKYQKDGFKWGSQNAFVSDGLLEWKIPNKIYSQKELLDLINLYLTDNVEKLDIAELKVVMDGDKPTTKIQLILKTHGLLGLPKTIIDMLGKCETQLWEPEEDNLIYFFHGHTSSESRRIFPTIEPIRYTFEGPIDMNFYKPSYIMLYSDFIQPVAVSGVYMNVMKIFPTSPIKMPYVIKEFKNPEYLLLNNYDLKEMTFQLRNHAGELINFETSNHNPVILNLHFSNYTA